MKINQSTVAMAAERQASKVYARQVTVGERYWVSGTTPQAAKNDGTDKAGWSEKSADLELSGQQEKKKAEEQEQQKKANAGSLRSLERQLEKMTGTPAQAAPGDTEEDFKIKMLRRLLESLRAMQEGRAPDYSKLEKLEQRSVSFSAEASRSFSFSLAASGAVQTSGSSVAVGGTGHWEERVTMSSIFSEKEVTSFSTAGTVKTADGRDISFNLNLEMSREFTQTVGMEYARKTFCVDPLVINLEGNPASFSDQTFFFDLDGNGEKEELAELSAGSGFLALDKNHDGVINDGNELFGTKSGDGFKDLAAYDEDGNGWIDENDSVFKDLKVWTKDEDGRERLVAIGAAGVGAIYLGKAATEFSLNKQENNETQGIVRSTGIYLKESGEVGTIQHVDLVI